MMKKLTLTILSLLFITVTSVTAQCKYGPRLAVGLSGLGAGNSSLAFQGGIFINAELKDRIGVQGEVLFSMKTGNTVETRTNPTSNAKEEFKTKYNFTYVDIPIYGYVPLSTHVTFLFGPQIGIVNKATQRITGPGITGDSAQKSNISGTSAKMGIAAGIDFQTASPIRFGFRFSTNGGEAFLGKSTFVGATVAYTMDW